MLICYDLRLKMKGELLLSFSKLSEGARLDLDYFVWFH